MNFQKTKKPNLVHFIPHLPWKFQGNLSSHLWENAGTKKGKRIIIIITRISLQVMSKVFRFSPSDIQSILHWQKNVTCTHLYYSCKFYELTPYINRAEVATRDLSFSGLIRRTAPFSCLLRHTRECGGSILTRIHTGVSKRSLNKEIASKCSTD